MKRFKMLALLLVAVFVFASCGQDENTAMEDKTSVNEEMEASNSDSLITQDQAQDIVLEDAGLKKEDVQFTKSKLEKDDGISKYELEFKHENKEHDYDVDANTGAILSKEIDEQDGNLKDKDGEDLISVQRAEEIALSDAGFTREDVEIKKADLDEDDGLMKYEVEFEVGQVDYEYEIDARTGEIISKQVDN